nr:hypothetical protein [Maliibacterium massiliense]
MRKKLLVIAAIILTFILVVPVQLSSRLPAFGSVQVPADVASAQDAARWRILGYTDQDAGKKLTTFQFYVKGHPVDRLAHAQTGHKQVTALTLYFDGWKYVGSTAQAPELSGWFDGRGRSAAELDGWSDAQWRARQAQKASAYPARGAAYARAVAGIKTAGGGMPPPAVEKML